MASSKSFRTNFRKVLVEACERLGTKFLAIEFQPVKHGEAGSTNVIYRIYKKPSMNSPVDLKAFTNPAFGPYRKIHAQDGNSKMVESFESKSKNLMIVPVMHQHVLDNNKQQSYRALGSFLGDDYLVDYHDAFLLKIAEEFTARLGVGTGKFSKMFMCTEGSAENWLHFRLQPKSDFYANKDWKHF